MKETLKYLVKDKRAGIAILTAFFIFAAIMAIALAVNMGITTSHESNYQSLVRKATVRTTQEFFNWRLLRTGDVTVPKDKTLDVSQNDIYPFQGAILNNITAPYVGGPNDLNDKPAVDVIRTYVGQHIEENSGGLRYIAHDEINGAAEKGVAIPARLSFTKYFKVSFMNPDRLRWSFGCCGDYCLLHYQRN